MEPRSRKQGASGACEAQAEGEVEGEEKADHEVKAQKEDNIQDDEEEVDRGSLS